MAAETGPVLIDTSAWIDTFRGKAPKVASTIRKLNSEDRAVTCGPVLFEIRRGLRPDERKKVLPLFEALRRLPFDETDWAEAGDLDAYLRRKGQTFPAMDVLIAYLCLKHNASVLSLDGHFKGIAGIRIHDIIEK